ncbi:DUF2341 domain-containing protein [Geomesophilobacter sediminis]|nr:DUF2341 domain-containing protein [Geomesophilobacter sediminis]
MAKTAGAALLLTLAIGSARAEAWWDAKWTARRKIAFDLSEKGAGIKENVTEVPVLVRLHSGNFNFGAAKKDGSDLRFIGSDDKSPLKFHIEKFDPKLEIGLVWVKVPQLAGGGNSDCIWLYYGNDSAPAGSEPGATYDTAQVLVFHLNEADGGPKDATSYANHAAAFSGAHGAPAAVGEGYSFKGNGEKLVVQRSPSLNFAKGLTFSCWVKIDQPQHDTHLFSWADAGQAIVVGIEQDRPYLKVGSALTAKNVPLALKAWHQVAVALDAEKQMGSLYIDGKEAGVINLKGPLPAPTGELAFGGAMAGNNTLTGDIDEIELSSVARPAGFIVASYASQAQEGKLMTCQAEESSKGGGENMTVRLLRNTAKSVTFDGWVIIILCTGILILASIVFVRKMMYLLKNRKANNAFLERFNDLHDPLELDPDDESLDDCSLLRIYQSGLSQLQHWVDKHGQGEDEVVVTGSGLSIFRAALERGRSEESAKVNAGLIVLTLGISGGPFWGLLGTVWGVMNTFASLAEAGEANLSAIAPGVASALACTLFGLLCAIPCLFAHTFLGVQMKHLNTETNHFIEEFALKVEGFHGEEA